MESLHRTFEKVLLESKSFRDVNLHTRDQSVMDSELEVKVVNYRHPEPFNRSDKMDKGVSK